MIPSSVAVAGISISPFVTVSSQKTIKPNKINKSQEDETNKQRTTYGLAGSVSFWRLFKFQLSVGQNQLTTTTKTQNAVDEFDEIDYEKDLNMSTNDPESEVKTIEIQRKGRASLLIDPSFSIFVLRAKAGVQATQRLFSLKQEGQEEQKYTSPITYKPVAGVGAGIKFGARMFFMAEYGFFFYKFPKTEPFEREVTVSYTVSL